MSNTCHLWISLFRTLLELDINLQLFIIVIIRILFIKFAGSSRVTKLLNLKKTLTCQERTHIYYATQRIDYYNNRYINIVFY